ncbi:MAG: hypothetical protein FJX54_21660 [Alphaproteobacteria bacterium]|nr:hypothetical protein [Alphaproteobacteria bacterium]
MSTKKMPPVPPANRNPKEPENDPQVTPGTPPRRRRMERMTERGQQQNVHQNTRNQGNPTSRGGNPNPR